MGKWNMGSELLEWDELPKWMRHPEVRRYWEILDHKRFSLRIKRIFDLVLAVILLGFLFIPMCIIAVLIKLDSKGSIFFRQIRVTKYGKKFRIHKFRTMVMEADQIGSGITGQNDMRITRIGKILRKYRLDELPQLIDVINGDMSFVGTRPESVKFVKKYTPEMRATLLMPAGITSEASIQYKDEDRLISSSRDPEKAYVEQILPEKMQWNLRSLKKFSLIDDCLTMFRTLIAVLGKGN